MSGIGRNEPCPCGSGKRFKECHGAIEDRTIIEGGATASVGGAEELLNRAERLVGAGDADAAEALAAEVLSALPEHPGALRILARCDYERGRPDTALPTMLRAARALSSFPLSPQKQIAVWSDLNYMFTQALSGIDSVFAAAKRNDYASWLRSLSPRAEVRPLVSVVLIVPEPGPWLGRALDSVFRQAYRHLELVAVHAAGDARAHGRLAELLRDCPFEHRVLSVEATSEPMLVNAGVEAARGAFVNVLHARHEFAVDRIGALVEQIASRDLAWGFSGVEFIDADGLPVGRADSVRTRRWREILASVAQFDTIGHVFIHQDYVAVDASNLFFSRALFATLGGMRDLPYTYAWDFCLRALWLAEPLHVETAAYRHRVSATGDRESPGKAEFEAAQVRMFRDYYDRACDEESVPPNPFAPSIRHWRMHFLKTVFQTSHVLMFTLDRLERFAEEILRRRAQQRLAKLAPGLDLLGFAFGEFGLGESLRALANACAIGGIPCGVKDVDMRLISRQADRSIASLLSDELKHRCSLYCVNPDMMKPVRQFMVEAEAAGIYNVGYWYWELEYLPREWAEGLARVDEIWVASAFVAEAVRRSTGKPVVKIPPPIEVRLSRAYRRSDFRLPEDRFLFLFSFDFNSFSIRKNPEGTIAAFKHAFGRERRDVGLVVKSINGATQPKKLHAVEDLIGGDERIVLIDEFFTRDLVSGLHSVVDAYVSLHRSEGLGLGLAESMYLGKPVIGTGYSGNLEFMDSENSCLVDFELVAVREGEYLYDDARFRWADPDVEHAALHMRRLVDDAAFRDRVARRGQETIRSRFTPANTAAQIRARLGTLGLL